MAQENKSPRQARAPRRFLKLAGLLALAAAAAGRDAMAQLPGVLGTLGSAAAAGRGGTTAARSGDPVEAMQGNPAGLAGGSRLTLSAGVTGGFADGSFRNRADPHGSLNGNAGALPSAAVAWPIGAGRFRAGLSLLPEMLMRANWRYIDPAGTAGVSYGLQTNRSEIVAERGAAGLAWSPEPNLALGATIGLVYNRNTLNAPYIFQEQPALAGLKVLLDLHTQGWGWNGGGGAEWQATSRIRLGAAWKSATFVQSHGDASGTASALFAALGVAADPAFHYRAEVDNHLPQAADAAVSWDAARRLRVDLQADFTNWSTAFHRLPVKLKEGSNATINVVAGSSAIEDEVWLRWRNQGTVRLGAEWTLTPAWVLRGGFVHASSVVPSSTLTPLTAAIFSNSLTAGAGWRSERWAADVAYQGQLPASQSVGQSELLAGEYSGSRVSVSAQAVTASVRLSF